MFYYVLYIANKFQLPIGFENSRDLCFKSPRPQVPVSRPRPQNFGLQWSQDQECGLEDYKTVLSTFKFHIFGTRHKKVMLSLLLVTVDKYRYMVKARADLCCQQKGDP